MTDSLLKTPLSDVHRSLGGKMVSFGGWDLPIQYGTGILAEHRHVREKVGLFDVSHMGEIRVRGEHALKSLEWMTTNQVSTLKAGQAHYTLFPNGNGGIVDDLIIYCLEPGKDYLLCVNAANTAKDFAFVTENNQGAEVENQSRQWGQIAVQGPKAQALLENLTGIDFSNCPAFEFRQWSYKGESCLVARTGYTGEGGAEIFVPWDLTETLWSDLLSQGDDVAPIGLGARDTLRTEMKYSLYGQEITDETNPFEAGLGWVVKPKEKDFIGKGPMLALKEAGLKRKLVGLEVEGRGIARPGYKAFSFDNEEIGEVTSGTHSPSLNKAIAIAYVAETASKVGTRIFIEIRNKRVEARVVKTPFYKN